MSRDYKSELREIRDLLEDIRKLMIFSIYSRDDITSKDVADALGLKASTIRSMFAKRKKK